MVYRRTLCVMPDKQLIFRNTSIQNGGIHFRKQGNVPYFLNYHIDRSFLNIIAKRNIGVYFN